MQTKSLLFLGKGHFSSVFACKEEPDVAFKFFNSLNTLREINQEIFILTSLSHPNIVKIMHHNIEERYVVLEKLDMDLFTFCTSDHLKMDYAQKINSCLQLLSALDHIHRRKIIHCDIKPDNILVDVKTMCLKIADFGISTIAKPNFVRYANVCALAYRAPECFVEGFETTYSNKIDVYAMGCVFYELFETGCKSCMIPNMKEWDNVFRKGQPVYCSWMGSLMYKFWTTMMNPCAMLRFSSKRLLRIFTRKMAILLKEDVFSFNSIVLAVDH